MPTDPEPFPADAVRTASPESGADVDALHAELASPSPDRAKIEQHVEKLRGVPAIAATVEGWFLHPNTQLFIEDLTELGL